MQHISIFILLCVGLSLTIGHIGAVKVGPWQDLVIHDCNHGLHFLPSSDLSMSFDGSMFNTILNHVLTEVKKRAKCNDENMATRKHVLCTYMPSIEMVLENAVHNYKMDTTSHGNKFNGAPGRNFFNKQNPFFRDLGVREARWLAGLIPTNTWLTLKSVWPQQTCNVEDFLGGKPCTAQIDLEDLLGLKLGFTVQKCSDENQYAPYFAITCSGNSCEKFLMPCVGDSECGNGGACEDIVKVVTQGGSNANALSTDHILNVLVGAGIVPDRQSELDTLKTAINDLNQCMINDYTKNMNFAWRTMYKIKNFIRKNLYRETDDFKERLSNQLKFCVPEEMRFSYNTLSQLGEKLRDKLDAFDVTEGSESSETTTAANACHSKGCDVQQVGDWICDTKCNNQECHWDGGDCDLPDSRKINSDYDKDRDKDRAFLIQCRDGGDGDCNPTRIREEPRKVLSVTKVHDFCGDTQCNTFSALLCKAPYCDLQGVLEQRDFQGAFYRIINESDTCPQDCSSGVTPTQRQGYYDEGFENTNGYRDMKTIDVVWKTSVADKDKYIINWDGSLPDGTKSYSVRRKYGILYQAPKGDALLSDSSGRTFFKFICDGTFGFGLGNGFNFLVRIPGIYKMINLGSSLVKYTQSCRYEMNQIGDITLDVFRANWELWNPMNGALLRLTQSMNGNRPSLANVEKDRYYQPKPYNIIPYPSEISFGGGQQAPLCSRPGSGKSCVANDNWKVTMPETCSYEVYEKYGICRFKYVGLDALFGTESEVLFEMARCSKESGLEDSLFEMAFVMTGDVATTMSPITWCENGDDCTSSEACVDVKRITNLDETLSADKIPKRGSALDIGTQFMRDPFATLVYGRKGGNEQCIEKEMPIQNSIRNLLRKMALLPEDSETELKICLPSWALDVSQLAQQAQNFGQNKMYFVNNGLVIEGLEKTGKSALYYTLDKYSGDTGAYKGTNVPAPLTRKADEGYVFQKISIDIQDGSKASTCISIDKLKRAILKHLKTMKYKDGEEKGKLMFPNLVVNDVEIKCDDSRRRRMLLASKVRLTVSIQLKKDTATVVAKEMAQQMATPEAKESVAANMQSEGIMLADDTLITPQSIESIDAETTTSATAETNPSKDKAAAIQSMETNKERNEVIEKMGGDVETEEEDDRVDVSIDRTVLIIIIVGAVVGCCVCVVAVGLAIYFIGKANGNNGAQVSQRAVELKASPVPQAAIHANPVHANPVHPNKMEQNPTQQQGVGYI